MAFIPFEFDDDAPDTSFQDKKDAIHKELSECLKDRTLPDSIQSDITGDFLSTENRDNAISDNFDSVTVMGIFRKIDEFKLEEEQEKAEYEELYARYEASALWPEKKPRLCPANAAETVNKEIELRNASCASARAGLYQ